MKYLRHLLGITKLDKEKNQCIRQKTHVALIILIIALEFDVSSSCNEEIKINDKSFYPEFTVTISVLLF